jgi:hypothetical protein
LLLSARMLLLQARGEFDPDWNKNNNNTKK